MPIIKSAKKRVNVAKKAAIRNAKTKKNFKRALKAFNAKPGPKTHGLIQSKIDILAKKGLIHKNKAARLKKRAAAKAKASKVTIPKTSSKTKTSTVKAAKQSTKKVTTPKTTKPKAKTVKK